MRKTTTLIALFLLASGNSAFARTACDLSQETIELTGLRISEDCKSYPEGSKLPDIYIRLGSCEGCQAEGHFDRAFAELKGFKAGKIYLILHPPAHAGGPMPAIPVIPAYLDPEGVVLFDSREQNLPASLFSEAMPGLKSLRLSGGGSKNFSSFTQSTLAHTPALSSLELETKEPICLDFSDVSQLADLEVQAPSHCGLKGLSKNGNLKSLVLDTSEYEDYDFKLLAASSKSLQMIRLSRARQMPSLGTSFTEMHDFEIADYEGRAFPRDWAKGMPVLQNFKMGSAPALAENPLLQIESPHPLKQFEVRKSKISSWPSRPLTPKLTSLVLSQSELTDLPEHPCIDSPNLLEVWIASPGIKSVPQNFFDHCTHQTFFNLAGLPITLTQRHLSDFIRRGDLVHIAVGDHDSVVLEDGVLPYVKWYKLDPETMRYFHRSVLDSRQWTFRGKKLCGDEKIPFLKDVESFTLSGWGLTEVPGCLKGSELGGVLDLGGNDVTEIPGGAFDGLKVQQLSLDHNPIRKVSPKAFQGMTELTHLILSFSSNPEKSSIQASDSPRLQKILLRLPAQLSLDPDIFGSFDHSVLLEVRGGLPVSTQAKKRLLAKNLSYFRSP